MKDPVDALVAAVNALISYLASQDVTAIPERQYEAHWMEPVPGDATRSQGKTALYTEPAPERILWTYGEQLTEVPPVAQLGAVLQDFADAHGGFPASSWLSSPTEIAARVLHEYLTRSGNLVVDEAIARQVILDYCGDLSAPTITVRSVFQVENFSAPRSFNLSEEITFRPISQDDIKEQARRALVPFPYQRPWLNTSDWICQVNKKGPRDTFEAVNWDHEGVRCIVAALGLTSPGTARFALLSSRHASPFLSSGTRSGGEQIVTGSGGNRLQFGEEHIEVAESLHRKVLAVFSDTKRKHLRLALGRYIAAAQRRDPEDQLVDHVIGLESLLAPDTDRLETTIRFRLRGAAVLPPHFGGHRERIDLMNKLYDLRSRIVHGGADRQEVMSWVATAEDALRHTLRWYMDESRWKRQPRVIVRELDQMMVRGGFEWAYPMPK